MSLWTVSNPLGKEAGKELCDALVVFENCILIISVKDIVYKPTEDLQTGYDRWNKAAIEKSIKQLKGAKRFLETVNEVKSKDGRVVFSLPPKKDRKYYFITISLGAKREIPLSLPILDEVVHFFDDYNLDIIFSELDTISDFIEYMQKKETFLAEIKKIVIGAEEDLLALYLFNNRKFPIKSELMIIEDGIWKGFSKKPEYLGKKHIDKVSYIWDSIIEELINLRDPSMKNILGYSDPKNVDVENALRILAKENRFSRRILSEEFLDFINVKRIASRVVESVNGIVYVFLKKPIEIDRLERQRELYARCFIVRHKINRNAIVIGIATENDISVGHSFDLIYFERKDWSKEDQQLAEKMIKDLKLFNSVEYSQGSADEYPKVK